MSAAKKVYPGTKNVLVLDVKAFLIGDDCLTHWRTKEEPAGSISHIGGYVSSPETFSLKPVYRYFSQELLSSIYANPVWVNAANLDALYWLGKNPGGNKSKYEKSCN